MLLGTMQDDGLAAKPRATDFSIEAIMAKEPRPSLQVRPQFIAGQYQYHYPTILYTLFNTDLNRTGNSVVKTLQLPPVVLVQITFR